MKKLLKRINDLDDSIQIDTLHGCLFFGLIFPLIYLLITRIF